MTTTPADPTTLVFQAPPTRPPDDTDAIDDVRGGRTRSPGGRGRATGGPGGPGELRMLKGARAAATGMRISDAQIRAVLEDPQNVQPDPNQPQRTQLRRDGLVVTTGNDGTILRITRRR